MTSPVDTARAAMAAGFPDSELVTAVAIAIAESSLNETATHRNANGSIDYGLWQINSVHGYPEIADGTWKSPTVNAQLAHRVWTKQGWDAWAVHRPSNVAGFGRYQLARPIAVTAVAVAGRGGAAAQGAAGTPGDAVGAAGGVIDGAAAQVPGIQLARDAVSGLRFLQEPGTWVRVAKLAVGGALLIGAAWLVVQGTLAKPAAAIIKAVK